MAEKRCWHVKVTFAKEAHANIKTLAVRPGPNDDDSPEAVCAHVMAKTGHRRGTKVYFPNEAVIDYEIDPADLPDPSEAGKPMQPLSSLPKRLETTKHE